MLGRWPFSYHYNCDDCKTVPKLEESCLPKTHIVPKLIWMKDLRDIEEVMSDPGIHDSLTSGYIQYDILPKLLISHINGLFGSLEES